MVVILRNMKGDMSRLADAALEGLVLLEVAGTPVAVYTPVGRPDVLVVAVPTVASSELLSLLLFLVLKELLC